MREDQLDFAGWSGGYLAIAPVPVSGSDELRTITTSHSLDGINWSPGQELKPAVGWSRMSVVEGPAGLLAVAWQGFCGGPLMLTAMWLSTDGIHWSENLGSAFAGATVLAISAGSIGYIATGYVGSESHSSPVAWTSKDARKWTRSNLSGSAFENSTVSGAVAFAGGFLLVGATWPSPLGDCPSPQSASVWWSRDGGSWKKIQLPGSSSDEHLSVWADRIGDREVVVQALAGTKTQSWMSTDGTTWSPIDLPQGAIVSDGNRALVVAKYWDESAQRFRISGVFSIDGGVVRPLAQSPDGPVNAWRMAMGPAGLLVVGLHWQSWLGVPTDA